MAQESRYYADIKQVVTVSDEVRLNELLKDGWELLRIDTISALERAGEVTTIENRKLIFVLGRKEDNASDKMSLASKSQENATDVLSVAQRIACEQIQFHETSESFAWAFATNKDGSPVPEAQALVEYLKKKGKLEQDGYQYSLSKDGKFIQRKKLKSA